MNALDFLVEFVRFEGTSEHLLPQHNQNTNASEHPIGDTEAGMLTSAYLRASEQYHLTQQASEQEATCNFPTNSLSAQHMLSISASHLPDPSVTNFKYHDIPQPSIEHDDHPPQTLTRYAQKEQIEGSSHDTNSIIPQAYYQHLNSHAPCTTGYEASNTQAPVLNMQYDPQTLYIFQPSQEQETHYVSFSEEASPVQIHCNNSICACWAQKPQSYHPTENIWLPWNTTQASHGPGVPPPVYNDWILESTGRSNFSTV
ncbi:hypothetical protein COCC4DRAFT_22496 [Bipolaris maydis ATCC 48331]|uniref:Uncharacterized protein n=2 Tax=Cochliobolus heterostrophus TaxID=5016 RepID=M2UE35_COCH5|nr:uncharacterized protein COCC4DRAFT_22496 [Bipolaris maydis ATCC 48331]EMD86258.1 hypothetical protein COCHEDRAFT_1034715 [Bipolaris maydis C5]KAH7551699.1 hypothetical protein BM1_09333 [Bipolaris maydis]ENI06204.1 hypothetical protein COCC4DRAFT_22496 [Bipolaris maydis ATCC 48331]KAJ5030068.1 hypothetical protein J3E73DRAFT_365374 [Bipolaris maydis]KAJ5065072.1 hypothetical protein J3E74DRAFT_401284 [Bipolaris maydis]